MKLTVLALAAGLAAIAGAAQAMPAAPLDAPAGAVTTIGWRCGPGGHVNRWGRCVPNGWVARPFVYRTYRPRVYYGYGGYRPHYYGHPHWHH